ncbi:MAG: TAXI family TRAP transporter solute-binding subunit [Alphaproteobacteria bacterium]
MLKTFARLASAAAVAAIVATGAGSASAERLVFMTGPAGGSWYPLGAAIKNIVEQEMPGTTVDIRPGAGLINLRGVAEAKADLGMGNVISTVDAIAGNPPFENKLEGICNLAALYQQYAQLAAVDASIKTWADLKGKRFATLPRGNTTEVAAQQMLKAVGLTYDDLSLVNFASITDQVNMAKDGQVDAIFNITAVPAGAYLDLSNSRRTHHVPITEEQFEKAKGMNAGWSRVEVRANAYPNQAEAVPIAGFPMHIIVNCERMSEETAYNITKALAKRVQELGSINKSLAEFTVEEMAIDVGIPFHPGSEKFYKEAGAL